MPWGLQEDFLERRGRKRVWVWLGANYNIPCQHTQSRQQQWGWAGGLLLCACDPTTRLWVTVPQGTAQTAAMIGETWNSRKSEARGKPAKTAWWAKESFRGAVLSLKQRSCFVWGLDWDLAEASKLLRCWTCPLAQRWTLNNNDSNKPWHLRQEISNSHLASLPPSLPSGAPCSVSPPSFIKQGSSPLPSEHLQGLLTTWGELQR